MQSNSIRHFSFSWIQHSVSKETPGKQSRRVRPSYANDLVHHLQWQTDCISNRFFFFFSHFHNQASLIIFNQIILQTRIIWSAPQSVTAIKNIIRPKTVILFTKSYIRREKNKILKKVWLFPIRRVDVVCLSAVCLCAGNSFLLLPVPFLC